MVLMRHGEALEADLLARGIDLLDFYRDDGALTARRLWVLVEQLLIQRGTALAVSISGERGRWSLLDEMVAGFLQVKPPEDKTVVEWRASQQERIKAKRAEREAARAATSSPEPST